MSGDALLRAETSPDSLDANVVRLNRYPLLILLGLGVVVVLLLVYSIYQRGASQQQDAGKEAVTETDTDASRKRLLEGYENLQFVEPLADATPLPTAGAAAPVADAAMVAPTEAPKPPEMSEEERLRLQQLRDLEAYRREAMMRAITAPTTVEAGKSGGVQADASEGATAPRMSALEQLQKMAVGAAGAGADPNGQANNEQFAATARTFGYSDKFREQPLSTNVLRVGTFIPAVMVSGINSDLPGDIIAQVSQDVRDTPTGNSVLIPQGTKIIGSYSNRVAYGQERVLLAWSRLSFPDGSVMELGNMGGMDEAGYAGVNDQVDRHTVETFQNATLISMLSAGAQMSQGSSTVGGAESASQQMAAALGQQWSQVGMEMVRKGMERQPTLTVRPGFRFNVFINKDLLLEPYQAKGALVGGGAYVKF